MEGPSVSQVAAAELRVSEAPTAAKGTCIMALKVSTLKNHLGTNLDPYFIHTERSGTVEFAELVDIMAGGRTTLTKPDIIGCLQLFTEELAKLTADGKYVKTPFGAFYLTAHGTMDDESQSFLPGGDQVNHGLHLRCRAVKEFEESVAAKANIVRVRWTDKKSPLPTGAISVRDGTRNGGAPGEFLRIRGSRLKFDPESPEQGVFFVNGSETRALQYAQVMPSLVIAEIPLSLQAGEYQLVVRTMLSGKKPIEGRLPEPLLIKKDF